MSNQSLADGLCLPFVEIWALMLFPDDTKRKRFIDAWYGKALMDLFPELSSVEKRFFSREFCIQNAIDSSFFDTISEEGLKSQRLQASRIDLFPGEFVGDVLLLLICARSQNKKIGRKAVFRAYSHGGYGNSERTLKEIWDKYKSVAHFWAAFLVCGEVPIEPEKLIDFLSFAELLRRFGVSYVPERGRETLLDGDAVQIDPKLVVPVEFPLSALQPSIQVLEILGISPPSGTARFRMDRILFHR